MHVIRTVLFSKDEAAAFERAHRLIDIAYPLASDPLVQRDDESRARAVQDTDPRRRVLTGLRNPYDPVARPRLLLAHEVLTTILDQVTKEASLDHWLDLADDPTIAQARTMAEVLAAERTRQQHDAREAIEILDEALSHVTSADDPQRLREQFYEGA